MNSPIAVKPEGREGRHRHDAGDAALPQDLKSGRHLEQRYAAGNDQGIAAGDPHHAKCGDKGRNPEDTDGDAVGCPEYRTAQQSGGDTRGQAVAFLHYHGRGHGGGGQNGSDRQVDAFRQNHKCLSDGDQGDDRRLNRYFEQIADGEEIR